MDLAELYSYPFIDLNTFSIEKPNYKLSNPVKSNSITNTEVNTVVPNVTTSHTEIDNTVNTEDENTVLCRICGKPLKEPTSRKLGMGPSCYRQFKASRTKQINLFGSIKTTKG